MTVAPFVLLVLATTPAPKSRAPIDQMADALAAFREGDYVQAARVLPGLAGALPRNHDYYLYFLAESQFYVGDYGKAASTFAELARRRDSRFAELAPWRSADCQWMQGKREAAAASYRKLVGGKSQGDQAVARFRIAEVQAESATRSRNDKAGKAATLAAARAFMQIHVDFPDHPLGIEAGKRAALLAPAAETGTAREPSWEQRLDRAETLSKAHRWQDALDELALLPATLPPALAVQRDFATGMAKYRSRSDYAGAAALLLGAAPKLSGGQAAFAAFHGARALSRIDHDDEAIARYHDVVAKYPGSTWAAEAQFRAGWLDINRGRFREALPDLRETLARYSKSAFADDAAWYVTLAHVLLGDFTQALRDLAVYEEAGRRNAEVAMRVRYWRPRILMLAGRTDDAKPFFRDCADRAPFHYYGLLARARLAELGENLPWPAPLPPMRAPARLHDPALDKAFELERAGLVREAGIELERNEAGLLKRQGKAQALPFLVATYPRLLAFRRAQRLAEGAGESAFDDARLFWESVYPRAYPEAVERYGKAAGAPDLFVYAVMRKESGYYPFAVSRSDARGLLQLIPSTGERVASKLGTRLFPDELFDADTNVRLGATYLGDLLRRFQGQEALAAGAYNAGANAMKRWCDQWKDRPLDEFVELITYDQAREYIKRVLGIYARYRYIYDTPLHLSLAVRTDYRKDGPAI
jgi:soluble lytic murein transglycosylase